MMSRSKLFSSFCCIIVIQLHVILLKAEHNKLIRVDGLNPTCWQRPRCRDYEVEASLVLNIDKSIHYMGNSKCCFELQADDDEYPYLVVRLLMPSTLYGDDYISVYRGDFGKLLANITTDDQNPYRDIYTNSSKVTIEFFKDRISRSALDILITAYGSPNGNGGQCDKDSFYCKKNNYCIDEDLVCDKFDQCSDDADEDHCNFFLPSNSTGEFSDLKQTVIVSTIALIVFCVVIIFVVVLFCFLKRNRKNNSRTPREADQTSCLRRFNILQRRRTQQQQPVQQMSMQHINRQIYKQPDVVIIPSAPEPNAIIVNETASNENSQNAALLNKNVQNNPPSYEEATIN